MDKPACPKCGGSEVRGHGKSRHGASRWWCYGCRKAFTPPGQGQGEEKRERAPVVEPGKVKVPKPEKKAKHERKVKWELPATVMVEGEFTGLDAQRLGFLRRVKNWMVSRPVVLPEVITKDEAYYLELWHTSIIQFGAEERRLEFKLGTEADEKVGFGVDDWLDRVVKLYSECKADDSLKEIDDGAEEIDPEREGAGGVGEGDEP